MAIDPGEKNIGVAISDPTGTIASPLTVVQHVSRTMDAARIADLANENHVELIVFGKAFDEDGLPTPASRRADRLAEAIQQQCAIPQKIWDESFSTQVVHEAHIQMGISRRKRHGHQDELAAAVILQSYLDNEMNK